MRVPEGMSAPCPRLGFLVRVVLDADSGPPEIIRLRASFAEWAASRGLLFQVHGTIRHWANPVWREGSQADHSDRESVIAWGAAHPIVISVEPGPIGDLDESGGS
jgi:hypothetical protein